MAAQVGYARCSTSQDLTAGPVARRARCPAERIYLDHRLTGTSRARPDLDQALAAVRDGDTFIVTKLDRLACSVRFALGSSVYDWHDSFAHMFLQIFAVIAEFGANLTKQGSRIGMAIARDRGKLRGRLAAEAHAGPGSRGPRDAISVHHVRWSLSPQVTA
jgi:DNA invertase Pin-like site-specific DNA recombinase